MSETSTLYSPEFLDRIEASSVGPWNGHVWRHMFGGTPPARANRKGARWNPPDVPAIYTSLEKGTALAEAEYHISLQPIRPQTSRRVYEVQLNLEKVADLSDPRTLQALGVSRTELEGLDSNACRRIGGAVAWLGFDGMLVPSARAQGKNLVVFEANMGHESVFEVVSEALLED